MAEAIIESPARQISVTIVEPDLEKVMPVIEALEDSLDCQIVLNMQAVVTSTNWRALSAIQEAFGGPETYQAITAMDTVPALGRKKTKRGPDIKLDKPRKHGPALTVNPNANHRSSGGSHSGGPRGLIKAWLVTPPWAGSKTEQITADEKNRRLAQGQFDPGTILYHGRAGRLLVIGQRGSEQRLVTPGADRAQDGAL